MKTKFNDDLFRLCHPVGQLRELNRRADLGAIEEKLEHLKDDREEPLWGVFGVDSGVYERALCSDLLPHKEEE